MRPRRLIVQAFGPFAGTVEVDFEAFASAGLFHVQGPTGAGKTSLLDAMCFALYGQVPGARRADQVRSDHAAGDLDTSVTLDFRLMAEEYRIERLPRQERAKRRGAGMTVRPETARLWHRPRSLAGPWEPMATSVGEVNAIVTRLLGLTAGQFQQVVMLPQGRFQEALLASTDDRRRLLRSLFATERFAEIVDGLIRRAQELQDQTGRHRHHLLSLAERMTSRLGEVGLSPPTDLAAAVTAGDLAGAVVVLQQTAASVASAAATALDTGALAEAAARLAGDRYAQALAATQRIERRRQAEETLRRARQDRDVVAQAEAALRRAGLAAPIATLGSALDAQQRQVADLERTSESATADAQAAGAELAALRLPVTEVILRALGDLPGAPNAEDWRCIQARGAEVAAAVAALSDAATQAEALNRQRDEHLQDALAHRTEAETHDSVRKSMVAELAVLEQRRAAAALAGERQRIQRNTVAALTEALAGARRLRTLDAAADAADERARQGQALAAQRRLVHLDLLERRIAGMAFELAQHLEDGHPCPVCGAGDHPEPATPSPSAPSTPGSETDEDLAVAVCRAATEAAGADQAAGRLLTAAAQARLAAQEARLHAVGALGDSDIDISDTAALAQRLADASAVLTDLEHEAAHLPGIDSAIAQARMSHQAAIDGSAAARRRESASLALADDAAARWQACAATVAGGVGDAPEHAVEAARAALRRLIDAASRCSTAIERLDGAAQQGQDLESQLSLLLASTDFATRAEAERCVLDERTSSEFRVQVRQHHDSLATGAAVLAELGPDEGLATPDCAGLEAAAESAAALALAEAGRGAVLQAAATEVTQLVGAAGRELDMLESLVPTTELAVCVADVCRGGGSGRQALETYVLAAFCEEITQVATARLRSMSAGRYSLHHTDERQAGHRSAGLDIVVLDGFTGRTREAGSLSGGELFQASLALALGLAEVVQRHAGGVTIDALFVDEGFGALDAEALEQAMAELDDLRDGGRLVGIISHVPGLKERIPAGIEVVASPTGSTLRILAPAGAFSRSGS